MGTLESASSRRILLRCTMLRRSYVICNHGKFCSPSKCRVSHTTVHERLTLGFKRLPQVVPLPPPSVLPCDRPLPSEYVVGYCIALIVESISLVFMLGRVVWLRSGINHDVPTLEVLRAQ
jgi:hypothetical protein